MVGERKAFRRSVTFESRVLCYSQPTFQFTVATRLICVFHPESRVVAHHPSFSDTECQICTHPERTTRRMAGHANRYARIPTEMFEASSDPVIRHRVKAVYTLKVSLLHRTTTTVVVTIEPVDTTKKFYHLEHQTFLDDSPAKSGSLGTLDFGGRHLAFVSVRKCTFGRFSSL